MAGEGAAYWLLLVLLGPVLLSAWSLVLTCVHLRSGDTIAIKRLSDSASLQRYHVDNVNGAKTDETRQRRIEKAVAEGTLTAHALPFTLHTESLDHEGLVRSLGFSSAAARTYGHPLPLAAKMSDVPSHSWVIPTLLAHAGIKFLHMGCNAAS